VSELEQIIRPFQDGRVATPQQYFQQGQVGVPPVVLRFGRSGQGRVLNGSISYSQTFYMTQYVNEKKTANWGTSG
jgi:hypothetical protein